MSSADIAACFPSEHDSLLGNDVESRRRSSKPFYLSRSSLETRDVDKSHYLVRTASRYVVNAFMVLFAVMFPFFGVINSARLSVEPADVACAAWET